MAPSFSVEMLQNKVFGTFESDLEFRLVHFAMMPLYSEKFDANAGLSSCLDNVYNSEAHSMTHLYLFNLSELRFGHITNYRIQTISTLRRRSISITELTCTASQPRPWWLSEIRIGSVHWVSTGHTIRLFSDGSPVD